MQFRCARYAGIRIRKPTNIGRFFRQCNRRKRCGGRARHSATAQQACRCTKIHGTSLSGAFESGLSAGSDVSDTTERPASARRKGRRPNGQKFSGGENRKTRTLRVSILHVRAECFCGCSGSGPQSDSPACGHPPQNRVNDICGSHCPPSCRVKRQSLTNRMLTSYSR